MKEQAINKINKIGKISSIIALIGKVLVGIGLAITLAVTVFFFVVPESFLNVAVDVAMEAEVAYPGIGANVAEEEIVEMQNEGSSISLVSDDKIVMTAPSERTSFAIRDVAWIMCMVSVGLLMTFITLIFVGALCKAFRYCQSPFEENVIKKMHNLAIALIPWTIVSTVANSVTESLLSNKLTLMLNIDLGVVLVVLVVLVLVYIFRYGAVLQQESDETL